VSKQLREDLLQGPGSPSGSSPTRRRLLPPGLAHYLEIWGLPTAGIIRSSHLRASTLVTNHAHERRLIKAGVLPAPRWVSPNYKFWYCDEIAIMIRDLPTERPDGPRPGRKPRPHVEAVAPPAAKKTARSNKGHHRADPNGPPASRPASLHRLAWFRGHPNMRTKSTGLDE
jgi:hypothetical protein